MIVFFIFFHDTGLDGDDRAVGGSRCETAVIFAFILLHNTRLDGYMAATDTTSGFYRPANTGRANTGPVIFGIFSAFSRPSTSSTGILCNGEDLQDRVLGLGKGVPARSFAGKTLIDNLIQQLLDLESKFVVLGGNFKASSTAYAGSELIIALRGARACPGRDCRRSKVELAEEGEEELTFLPRAAVGSSTDTKNSLEDILD
jgi:hypothetical protein